MRSKWSLRSENDGRRWSVWDWWWAPTAFILLCTVVFMTVMVWIALLPSPWEYRLVDPQTAEVLVNQQGWTLSSHQPTSGTNLVYLVHHR